MTPAILAILLLFANGCEPELRLVDPDLCVSGELMSQWRWPDHRKNESASYCARYSGTPLWGDDGQIECCMICDTIPDQFQCGCLVIPEP